MKNHMNKTYKINKLWGGAFIKPPKDQVVQFTAGRDVVGIPPADEALIPYEIQASEAYVKALFDQKLISKVELTKLLEGLTEIQTLYDKGQFHLDPAKEDVHTNIESYLIDKFGIDIGGKIHTGRSRNEQVAIDVLLYTNNQNDILISEISMLIETLKEKSKEHKNTIIPGYTHYQMATVTTFGTILDAFAIEFSSDLKRFKSYKVNELISPLGSSMGYGSTLPIDKYTINTYLGLPHVFENSIQAITFKDDFGMIFVFNLAILLNHLSTLAQTLIIFSTKEFGFISLSDEYSTGSSIMPQKKNPDPLEVMKAKASMVTGYLVSMLGISKASFIGYNRDSQWMKYSIMDAIREAKDAPSIMQGIIETLVVYNEKAYVSASSGFILALSIMEGLIADYSIPMRKAKMIVEYAVKMSDPNIGISYDILYKSAWHFGCLIAISKNNFSTWTHPTSIIKKQEKNGGAV
jgi:argininosuccinate lyase